MTNGDKIRSMNDDELAEFLAKRTACLFCKVGCQMNVDTVVPNGCKYTHRRWLKQEAK